MIRLPFIIIFLVYIFQLQAGVFTMTSAGAWNNASNWDNYPGLLIAVGDTVYIEENAIINTGELVEINGFIANEWGDTLTVDGTLTVNGNFRQDGDLIVNNIGVINSALYEMNGRLINNGDFEFNGQNSFCDNDVFNNDIFKIGFNSTLVALTELNNAAGGQITVDGKLKVPFFTNNYGVIDINGELEKYYFTNVGVFVNEGELNIYNSGVIEGGFVNGSSGVVEVSSNSTMIFTNTSTLTNDGILRIFGVLTLNDNNNFVHNSQLLVKQNGVVNYLADVPNFLNP